MLSKGLCPCLSTPFPQMRIEPWSPRRPKGKWRGNHSCLPENEAWYFPFSCPMKIIDHNKDHENANTVIVTQNRQPYPGKTEYHTQCDILIILASGNNQLKQWLKGVIKTYLTHSFLTPSSYFFQTTQQRFQSWKDLPKQY